MTWKIFPLYLFFLLALLSSVSCRKNAHQDESPKILTVANHEQQGIQFEIRHFLKESEGCANEGKPCARVKATFPVAVSGPHEIRSFINDTISRRVRESLAMFVQAEAEQPLPDLEAIGTRFLRDYENFVQDVAVYQAPWETETTGEVLFQGERILSVSLFNYSYTGGAHPNASRALLNFDLETKTILHLEELVIDHSRMKQLVEKRFRAYHQLEESVDLNEAGFFWDQSFFLPANFAIREDGLFLFYNNYEAAPYAAGATEILLPWSSLEGVLNTERIF